MTQAIWWRVELTADGTVASCVAVETKPETPDGAVVYVLAETEKLARYKAYKLRQKLIQRERRARYRADGKCQCGRELDDPEFKKCTLCRQRNEVHRARSDGKLPPLKPGEKGARIQERRLELRDMVRLEVLLEVSTKLLNCRSNREFKQWLEDAIRKAGGKSRAA
jgi:hypothetical protein